jgi:hypothetical protein
LVATTPWEETGWGLPCPFFQKRWKLPENIVSSISDAQYEKGQGRDQIRRQRNAPDTLKPRLTKVSSAAA